MGHEEAGNPSWWSCRIAGTENTYSARGLFTSFDFPKCQTSGENLALPPVDHVNEQCALAQDSTQDQGYNDAYRGWYDVQGCGECNDYCRWVGNSGSHGDPSGMTASGLGQPNADGQQPDGNPSFWSCRLAGTTDTYSYRGQFSSFEFPRCAGQR